jgi:hypothetical protein
MNTLEALLSGFRENFVAMPNPVYLRPDRSGFARDVAALRSDVSKVACDLCAKTKESNEQINRRTAQEQST